MSPKPTKVWKVAAAFFGGFTLLFAAFILFLPRTYYVSRAALVDVTPEQAYAAVADLSTWPRWAVWFQGLDAELVWRVEQAGSQPVLSYRSERLGRGAWTLTEAKPSTQITLTAEVGEQGSSGLHRFTFEAENGKTRIVWSMMGEAGEGLLAGLTSGTREQLAVKDFDASLSALKACLEAQGCSAAKGHP